MLSHVTATIESVSYSVIIYFICACIYLKCFELFIEEAAIKKETPAGIPVGVSCILKGFDVVFRVFLPQFGIEASFLRVENHMEQADRASVWKVIRVLV